MTTLRAVYFDVGETIVDETAGYHAWADWLGVPRLTLAAVLGAVIARGGHHTDAFRHFRPDVDLDVEQGLRRASGRAHVLAEPDLYPDARPCLAALRAQGLVVGLAGNQPADAKAQLRALDLPVHAIHTSAAWGAEKPGAAFFERMIAAAGHPAEQVLYVGDRLDNDMRPAQDLGISTAFVRRGPWGHLLHDDVALGRCLFRLDALTDLPDLVAAHNAGR